jgi:hypothetical protein
MERLRNNTDRTDSACLRIESGHDFSLWNKQLWTMSGLLFKHDSWKVKRYDPIGHIDNFADA